MAALLLTLTAFLAQTPAEGPVAFGLAEFRRALEARGLALSGWEIGKTAGPAESYTIAPGRITGADDRGLMYGLLEAAEQLEARGSVAPSRGAPRTPMRGIRTFLHNRDLERGWYYSRGYWDAYFAMLARSRFNRFNLVFGHQTNYLAPAARLRFTIPADDVSARWDLMYYFEILRDEGGGWLEPDPDRRTPYFVVETREGSGGIGRLTAPAALGRPQRERLPLLEDGFEPQVVRRASDERDAELPRRRHHPPVRFRGESARGERGEAGTDDFTELDHVDALLRLQSDFAFHLVGRDL